MARTGSELITHGRRLNDLALALVESVHQAGGDDSDARRVFSDRAIRKQLGQLVMKKLVVMQFPSNINAPKFIPKGEVVIRDVEPSKFRVSDLEFVSLLRDDKESVSGKEMCQRAVMLRCNFGLCDAKRLCQNEIPENLRNKRIVFPGTVLVEFVGSVNERVPVLVYASGRWNMVLQLINGDYSSPVYSFPRIRRVVTPGQRDSIVRDSLDFVSPVEPGGR